MTSEFIDSIYFPRISVDFSNDTIWGDNRVLLSKNDIVVDSAGNEVILYEGLKVYAYEENIEYGNNDIFDNIIANGVCTKNITGEKENSKWLMIIDDNGIHFMSELKK